MPQAQYTLGEMYETGVGVEVNLDEASKWYKLAAEQGNSEATKKLLKLKDATMRK